MHPSNSSHGSALLAAGFSLVEMLVVVVIVAVLASIAMPLAELAHKRANEEELRHALREIRGAIDAYKKAVDEGHIPRKANESGYPLNLDVLVDGVEDARSPERAQIYFLRSVPTDPFSEDEDTPPARTWALRSYASPPDKPHLGDDVFDVHSQSDELGLNGIPYSRW